MMKITGCYLKLNELVDRLSNAERRVAEYILKNPEKISSMPIEELAIECNTSKSSVVRLCKTLGVAGYKEFRMVLLADLINNNNNNTDIHYEDILPCDDLETLVRSVSMNSIKSIENTLNMLNMNELERAINAIAQAKRVDFYGVGNSGIVALDAQMKFLRINKFSFSSAESHKHILYASSLKKGDVVVLISYSGETKDVLDILDIIKESGATSISITRYGKNTLSEKTDINLCTPAIELLVRSGAMGSRIAQLNLIDILFSAVAKKEFTKIKKYLDKTMIAFENRKNK